MYNRSILIGRLTAEPELKQTQSGIAVMNFQIAVNRRFANGSDRKADFITIIAWRNSAEFVSKYFHKGDAVGIEGSIQTRNYEDKSGNKRTAVEVVADQVFFVGGKGSGGGNFGGGAPMPDESEAPVSYNNGGNNDFTEVDDDGEDLPF